MIISINYRYDLFLHTYKKIKRKYIKFNRNSIEQQFDRKVNRRRLNSLFSKGVSK